MTLEYITFCIEETIRACDIDDPYDEGYQDALCWVSELLDNLEPTSYKEKEAK